MILDATIAMVGGRRSGLAIVAFAARPHRVRLHFGLPADAAGAAFPGGTGAMPRPTCATVHPRMRPTPAVPTDALRAAAPDNSLNGHSVSELCITRAILSSPVEAARLDSGLRKRHGADQAR